MISGDDLLRFWELSTNLLCVTRDGRFLFVNPAWTRVLGWAREELKGRMTRDIIHPADHHLSFKAEARLSTGEVVNDHVVRALHKDGSYRNLRSLAVIDQVTGRTYSVVEDVTDALRAAAEVAVLQHRLELLVRTDPLTSLLNRRGGEEVLAREVRRLRRWGLPLSVVMFDIDHFKLVNDTFGHSTGDVVLVEVSARLRRLVRETDAVARWGGEEFLAILGNVDTLGAIVFATRVLGAIATVPIEPAGTITVSAGTATLTLADTPRTLLSRADEALYGAKRSGRNRVTAYRLTDD